MKGSRNIVETVKEQLANGKVLEYVDWLEDEVDTWYKLVARAGEKYRPHWYYPFKVEAKEDMYREGILNQNLIPLSSLNLGKRKYVGKSGEIRSRAEIFVDFEGKGEEYTEILDSCAALKDRLEGLKELVGPLDRYREQDEDEEEEEDYYDGDAWEYKTLTSLDEKTLKTLGRNGWEMCGIEPTLTYPSGCIPESGPVHGVKYYFKRRIDL